jgi:hypothetical protein
MQQIQEATTQLQGIINNSKENLNSAAKDYK